MTWLRDVVDKLNRTGLRTDPCGTPNGRCCGQDSVSGMLMLQCLSEKYDLNHRRDVQEIPKCLRRRKRINRIEGSFGRVESFICRLISDMCKYVHQVDEQLLFPIRLTEN